MKILILSILFLVSCGKESIIVTQRIEESSESIKILKHCLTTGNFRYYRLFSGNNGFIGVFNSRTSIFFNDVDVGESDIEIIDKAAPESSCFNFTVP